MENTSRATVRRTANGPRVPVSSMVENIVGCKWSLRILDLCAAGHTRPSAVLRACPGLSAKVMNERWRKLMRYDIVERTVQGSKPPVEVDYRLTSFGRRFIRLIEEVRALQTLVDGAGHGSDVRTARPAERRVRRARP